MEDAQISMDIVPCPTLLDYQVATFNPNSYVYQSNYLIENRPRMSRDEHRFFVTILSVIARDGNNFNKTFQVPVSEFASLWGLNMDGVYKQVKAAIKALQEKRFVVETIENGKRDFQSAPLIAYARYRQGSGFCEVRIDEFFKPYLVNLSKQYTRYMLRNVTRLKEVHSMRLYEILKQYETLKTRTFTVETLKEILNLEGKYRLNADFVKAIKNSIAKINEKTDLTIKANFTGKGDRLFIEFKIASKETISNENCEMPDSIAAAMLKKMDYNLEKDPEAPIKFIEWIKEKPSYNAASSKGSYLTTCIKNRDTVAEFILERNECLYKMMTRAQNIEEAEELDRRMQDEMQEIVRTRRESGDLISLAAIFQNQISH